MKQKFEVGYEPRTHEMSCYVEVGL